jgi:hydrogenase/urease accessory protein HupE
MQGTKISLLQGFVMGLAMLGCLMLGIWHGNSLGEAKAILEYELGYEAGKKDALYARPVSEELEMVCVGLWIGSLAEKKDTHL